jgi:hypothetical protein
MSGQKVVLIQHVNQLSGTLHPHCCTPPPLLLLLEVP